MRNVFPTDQVFHLWAHAGQESARNGSNVSFNGPELYSYNTTIAAIIDNIVYISANNMSVTTAKHISLARQATRHMEQFSTTAFSWSGSNPRLTHEAMILPAVQSAIKTLDYAMIQTKTRKQTKLNAVSAYMQERERITTHAARFNVAVNMPVYEVSADIVADFIAKKEAERAAAEAARIKAQKKQQKEDKKQFNIWLTTGAGRCPYSFIERENDFITLKPTVARMAPDEPLIYKVVTSQGAECPLDHAIKALRFWESKKTPLYDGKQTITFTPYHTNGHVVHLGHFTLDEITERGDVRAGCHFIKCEEIQRFSAQWREVLGL